MRFEIKGNAVSFETNRPEYWKPSEEYLEKWFPVVIQFVNGTKTFYVERSDRLEEIRIKMDNDDEWLK